MARKDLVSDPLGSNRRAWGLLELRAGDPRAARAALERTPPRRRTPQIYALLAEVT